MLENTTQYFELLNILTKNTNSKQIDFQVSDNAKLAEALLLAKKFQQIVESTDDILWETNTDFKLTYISPSVEKMLGFKQFEILEKGLSLLMSEKNFQTLEKIYANAIAAKSFFRIGNITLRTKSGKFVIYEIMANPVMNENNDEAVGFIGSAHNVTKRKEAENRLLALNNALEKEQQEQQKKLQAINNKLNAIFRSTLDGLAVIDLNGAFLENNQKLEEITGYSVDELKRLRLTDIWHARNTQEKNILHTSHLNKKMDGILISKKSKKIYVSLIMILLGCKTKILLSMKDMTKEHKSKNMIIKYSSILDEHLIISKTAPNGMISFVSQAFLNVSGYSKKELLGSNHNIIRHPDTKTTVYSELWHTIKSGKIWQGEIKNKRKDNSDYWLKAVIEPEYNESGHIIGYISIGHDITDKKRLEELVITDELTTLYNRRCFNMQLGSILELCKVSNLYIMLAIIDVDNFKKYNDTYGHLKGDEALKWVAKTIKSNALEGMSAFRIGGEEFALLFASEQSHSIIKKINSIRRAIEELEIEHIQNEPYNILTASFGIYVQKCSNNNKCDPDEIHKKADELLYRAKEDGRNTISYLID